MPVREMARFAELRRDGHATLAERAQLLDKHADRIRRRISELRGDLRAIDVKRAVLESRNELEVADGAVRA
jgi:DNA-binding transcriptional MerR regulator